MSYLLDKKIKQKRIVLAFFVCILLIILFYFRTGIFNGLSFVSHGFFRPIIMVGNNIGGKFTSLGVYFLSKSLLEKENENLRTQLVENQAHTVNYNSILAENISLKEILNRKTEDRKMILSAILSKPNQSIYDTLIIDVGTSSGIEIGDMVFIFADIPIGKISEAYLNSSKVILFSTAGEKTQVVVGADNTRPNDPTRPVGQVFTEVVGRGGGNFEMIMPRDFVLKKGDQVVLSGIVPYVLGVVETIISDPRDPFIKALLVSPVNIQELKFVEVEIIAR